VTHSAPPSSIASTVNLELFYFDIEGKAEPIRLAAAKGGPGLASFKDTRLTRGEFAALQATPGALAYGQVPALQVNGGEVLTQSAAILKYVGTQVGLYPDHNGVLAARVDALLDFEADAFAGLTVSRYPGRFGFGALGLQGTQDRSCPQTARVRAELNATVLPKHLGHLEALLARSPTGW
jgi:glutathione S-transferase